MKRKGFPETMSKALTYVFSVCSQVFPTPQPFSIQLRLPCGIWESHGIQKQDSSWSGVSKQTIQSFESVMLDHDHLRNQYFAAIEKQRKQTNNQTNKQTNKQTCLLFHGQRPTSLSHAILLAAKGSDICVARVGLFGLMSPGRQVCPHKPHINNFRNTLNKGDHRCKDGEFDRKTIIAT